jgi:hypothetical protein
MLYKYDQMSFEAVNGDAKDLEFTYIEAKLDARTALLAKGHEAICIFVNDDAGAEALQVLHENGVDTEKVNFVKLNTLQVKFIALRCAGFNNVCPRSNDLRPYDRPHFSF